MRGVGVQGGKEGREGGEGVRGERVLRSFRINAASGTGRVPDC